VEIMTKLLAEAGVPRVAAVTGRTQSASARNAGLDLARALAITAVFVDHASDIFVVGAPRARVATIALGLFGVELFFSLSGFLIGRMLIALARDGVEAGGIGRFLGRRWFRTLPMYYAAWIAMSAALWRWNWGDLLFLQNFGPPEPGALVVSWSLVMEEWFYLLFPVFMLGVALAIGRRRIGVGGVLGIVLAIILLCTTARLALYFAGFPSQYFIADKNPILRLDCAAYGVLAAALDDILVRRRRPAWLGPVAVAATITALLVVLVWLGLYVKIFEPAFQSATGFTHWGPYYFAVQYAVFDLASATLVFGLFHSLPRMNGVLGRPVTLLSRISYSVYLVHVPLLAFGTARVVGVLGRAGGTAMLTVAVLLTAYATYRLIEQPFMALRDRLIPMAATRGGR
jgi:peptidoglycan/LPS O-acetylase OafA/YrhL